MSLPLSSLFALLPSGSEWLWILIIVVLLFGGSKLPSLARGLGESIKEFKKASKEASEDDTKASASDSKKIEAPKQSGSHGAN
jgi:sec-independent protein translocase protein TatA